MEMSMQSTHHICEDEFECQLEMRFDSFDEALDLLGDFKGEALLPSGPNSLDDLDEGVFEYLDIPTYLRRGVSLSM